MDAVWIDVPEYVLAERSRYGHDKLDELWEGVLHMPPQPIPVHNLVAVNLYIALAKIGAKHGLVAYPEATAVYAPDLDPLSWRVPDASLVRPEQVSDRGLEGAVLAVEVLSPRDESRKKFGFYARVGVSEVWIVHPKTREPEIYTIVDGAFALLPPVDSVHRSPLLGISLEVIAGPKLVVRDGDSLTEI
jgi:Uma2 family endonuclease